MTFSAEPLIVPTPACINSNDYLYQKNIIDEICIILGFIHKIIFEFLLKLVNEDSSIIISEYIICRWLARSKLLIK